MKVERILIKIALFFTIIFYLNTTVYSDNTSSLIYMLDKKGRPLETLTIDADLNGDSKNEKIIIKNLKTNLVKADSAIITLIIQVFEHDKLVYEYKEEKSLPVFYIITVRFPGESEDNFRDIIFIVTSDGLGYLNILSCQKDFNEGGELKKKSYKYLKTNIEITTPYGFFNDKSKELLFSKIL